MLRLSRKCAIAVDGELKLISNWLFHAITFAKLLHRPDKHGIWTQPEGCPDYIIVRDTDGAEQLCDRTFLCGWSRGARARPASIIMYGEK